MSQFLLLPPPPPPPPSLPKSLPKEAETESDDDDDSIGSIPLPYGPPPRPMDLNGCFNAEFSTPKSHRNRNPIINKVSQIINKIIQLLKGTIHKRGRRR
jgi:hypothetical protein